MRRLPNGYGGITKLSGNRRRPYMAYVTTKQGLPLANMTDIQIDGDTYEEMALSFAEKAKSIGMPEEVFRKKVTECLTKAERSMTVHSRKVPIGYYATAKEAQIALAEYNRNPLDINGASLTFGEVFEMAMRPKREKLTKRSVESLDQGFKRYQAIADIPLNKITPKTLQDVVDGCAGLSASRTKVIISVPQLVFNYAIKYDWMVRNPADKITMPNVKEKGVKTPFTEDDVKKLWSSVDNSETVKCILILIYTGVRVGEFLNIKTADIKDGLIYVNGTKTKAAKRIVPINPKIAPLVDELAQGEYLYHMNYTTFRKHYLSALKKVGLSHTIHETRHTFATYSVDMDFRLRQFIMGHANNNITDDVYTHIEVFKDRLKEEILKFRL